MKAAHHVATHGTRRSGNRDRGCANSSAAIHAQAHKHMRPGGALSTQRAAAVLAAKAADLSSQATEAHRDNGARAPDVEVASLCISGWRTESVGTRQAQAP